MSIRNPASARALTIAFAIFTAVLMTVPTAVIAQETAPEGPRTELTPEEREAFLLLYLDVFAHGRLSLNETPGTYDYEGNLKKGLVDELLVRLKAESPDIAAQFDPAVAGPMFGLSTPEDPLMGLNGEPITQAHIDAIYGSFLAGLIFDREDFVARLAQMLEPLTPDASDLPAPPSEGEVDDRNSIRDELEAEPYLEWANDLPDATPPAEFVPVELPELVLAPVQEVPLDLSQHVASSPFNAADASAWLDPDFRLALPNLLDFLGTLTDLPADELLRDLGLLAQTAGEVVSVVEGPLESFPQLAGPVGQIAPIADAVTGALTQLPAPAPVRFVGGSPTDELPPEAQAAIAEANALTTSTQYVAIVNGVTVQGAWETPTTVDVDADGVPDALIDLRLDVPTVGVGDADPERVPLFTFERLDPVATAEDAPDAAGDIGAMAVRVPARTTGVPELAVATPEAPDDLPLPESPIDALDLTLAFVVPETGAVVAVVASAEGGVDTLELRLRNEAPGIDVSTAGGEGAFHLATAVVDGDALRIATIESAMPPANVHVEARIDASTGVAQLESDLVPLGQIALGGVHATPTARLALGVSGDALAPFLVETEGIAFDVTTLDGTAMRIDRQEGIGASATSFTTRTLILADAPDEIEADLGDDAMSFSTATAGRDVTMLVGSVSDGAFTSGAWAEVQGAGRRATLSLAASGVAFTSDRTVDLVRAVRADSAAAALTGALASGTLLVKDDLLAWSIAEARSTTATPTAAGYDVEVVSDSDAPFLMMVDKPGDLQQYLLSNLPHQATFGLSEGGLALGASENVDSIAGYMRRAVDGIAAPPTTTVLAAQDVHGSATVAMAGASVNTFLAGSVGDLDVLASNVLDFRGRPVFAALPGQHTFADVNGLLHQHSAGLTGAVGSITGALTGPLSNIDIQMSIAGELCQQFGRDDTQVTLCISNVPSRITIGLEALPAPKLTYDASAIIDEISLHVEAPTVDALLAIESIPKHIELLLAQNDLTLSTDTRLGGLTFAAEVGTTTIGAGILDLPRTLNLAWGTGGVTPSMPAGDAIGRAYLFVSQPGLAFNFDIVHLPPSVLSWNANSFSFGPTGDRIGSAIVQLAVSDLQFVVSAVGIPGVTLGWNTAGGSLVTNGVLDSVTVSLAKGPVGAPTVSFLASIVGVPRVSANWNANSMGLTLLSPGKIQSMTFQFSAGDLLLYLGATGVPTTTFTMSGGGLTASAPSGLDLITLVLAKGSGYYNPFFRTTDFVGLYLRPDALQFGISARVSGLKSLSYSRNDALKQQLVSVGFTTDKSFQLLADLDSAALTAYADVLLTNLAATTTLTITSEGVALTGTPLSPFRTSPWLQAYVGVGTPLAYDQTPDPRWPWQTTGASTGIMGNTMVDTTSPGANVATKWKVYAPLPNVLSFSKVTSNGMPTSYTLNTGVSLGKLDLRTNLKVNLNLCSWCSPYYLNTLAVATVSNLPTTLSVSQGLGSGGSAGSPSFTISTGQSINKLFLGLRFDNGWYSTGDETGGFPIYASLGQIPTSVGLTVSKSGGWSSGNTPAFSYSANANTLDASFYLNIGQLWTMFGKPTVLNAAAAGRSVPNWLVGLAQMDATGHLLLQVVDVPAAGILIYRSGQAIVVDPQGSAPLTKFFGDFNLRLERNLGNSGCWICGVVQLDYWYTFGYWFEINQLSLLLENLRYVSLDPSIESIIHLDGHLVFHFRASVGISFSAGVRLSVNVLGASYTILCLCLPTVSLSAMVDPGFISFQVNTHTWSINYFTFGWPCHWAEPWYEPWWHAWCETHYYVGVTYTVPENWQWDLPIAYPPYVPFRGLNLYSGTHHVFLNPRVLNCAGSFCWEVGRLIPPQLMMAYAYVKYTSISGVQWWDTYHEHW